MRSVHLIAFAATCALVGLAGQASAGDFYFSGQTGTSIGTGTTSGENTLAMFRNSGEADDSSPMVGGAIGFEFLLGDLMSRDVNLPESIPWKLRLPNFGVRLEVEGIGARDYEIRTEGFTATVPYHSDVSSFSVMLNNWLDVPVYPAVKAVFGRVPALDPLSLFFGGGLGYSRAEVSTTDNIVRGEDISNNFAWQAGGGIGYDLTDRFTITAGYRYFDSGSTKVDLVDGAGTASGDFEIDMHAHEVMASIRVDFVSIPWPRRAVRSHDW